ncbi:hypothetical protein Cni_G01751 [Canna indica]|uniref:Uncharacterized protein n=1 Tax=Canna indica TaxID=4628 RepID=A0AAQ3JPR5_9LILI|nr:hypothetical protein Cni_G01751 [Canna indica]
MAPAFGGGRRKTCCKTCHGVVLLKEKPEAVSSKQATPSNLTKQETTTTTTSTKNASIDNASTYHQSGYSTPKSKRSHIPELPSCPPAPKKRRLIALHRPENSPSVSFFTSPDLDLFFLCALHEISL